MNTNAARGKGGQRVIPPFGPLRSGRRVPAAAKAGDAEADDEAVGFGSIWAANRALIIAMVLLLIAYLIITVTVPMFRTIGNLIAFLVLEAILVFAFKVSGVFVHGRSAFIGLIVLIALIVISAFTIALAKESSTRTLTAVH